jgi:hypothetical protein
VAVANEFRQLLEAGDVAALRRAWHRIAPTMPQPDSDEQAEVVMHHARTQSHTVGFRHRAYSHRWLTERMLPSALPDQLKPSAERMYPVVVEGVGVSVNFRSPDMAPAALEVRGAINEAIQDCYADGRTEPAFVTQRMDEAKRRTLKALFGG